MVIDRQRQTIQHQHFVDLPSLLTPDDLSFNDTRVIPARLFGQKESGGRIEVLFERCFHLGESSFRYARIDRRRSAPTFYSLIDACRKSLPVSTVSFELEFLDEDPAEIAEEYGRMPLPYIKAR